MNSIDCPNCGKDINAPVIFCPHYDKISPESIQKLLYEKPKLSKKDKAIKAAKTGAAAACIAGNSSMKGVHFVLPQNMAASSGLVSSARDNLRGGSYSLIARPW